MANLHFSLIVIRVVANWFGSFQPGPFNYRPKKTGIQFPIGANWLGTNHPLVAAAMLQHSDKNGVPSPPPPPPSLPWCAHKLQHRTDGSTFGIGFVDINCASQLEHNYKRANIERMRCIANE